MDMTRLQLFALHSPLTFFIAVIFLHFCLQSQVTCSEALHLSNETDVLSLLAFKAQITNSDSVEALATWNLSNHFCQWKGVSCSDKHQRVTALNLQSQSLAGSISPAIGNLSFLRVLDLSNNTLQGEVPLEISNLFRLETLYLQNNYLEGPISRNLSTLSKLTALWLQRNNFTGQVPPELGSLSRLRQLYMSKNVLQGPFPASFGNLSSLEELLLSDNMLIGSVPEAIAKLKRLKMLDLSLNSLTGLVPSALYNLSSLTHVSLGSNSFQGALPSDMFFTLPNLKLIYLWVNNFSGLLPSSISNASNLERVIVAENKFAGTIPTTFRSPSLIHLDLGYNNLGSGTTNDLSFITSLTNSSNLTVLHVGVNNLEGFLPASIGNLSIKLELLSVSDNRILGNIPSSIGNLVGLNSLDLSLNQLTGSMPETIGNLQKLEEVGFGKNRLSGSIPYSIGNLSVVSQLWLEDNNFEGNIPSSLGNCRNLALLHLYGNELNGTIPKEVLRLSSLSKSLNLSQNRLSGSLPYEVGSLTNLVELDVSRNELSGEIPSTIGSCMSMERLYLDDNSFRGNIPSTLKALRGLEELNLSRNNLSGELPKEFGDFKFLKNLDLSHNNFEGEVPKVGVFSNTSQISLYGNQRLCGGIPGLHLPTCSVKKHKKGSLSLELKVVVSVVLGLLALSLVLILSWMFYKKKRKQPSQELAFHGKPRNISYRDLYNATNGFSSNNLVGMGGFGSVYKGVLESDQTIVAVKVLDLQKSGASKSFITECEALRNIRHKNLVKVVTACSSLDHQGNDFKAIVYEFMPNGNLERWLHRDLELDNMIQEPKILNLSQRLDVAIDVATAMDYLHNQCEQPIIHRDLKPSNILLDDQMIAHVGDFGLAKIIQPSKVQISTNQINSSTGVKGTIGYAAPEYGMGSIATIQGDVYSFGILLLEIFTGKRPTDETFKEGLDLQGLAKMSLQKGVMEIIDHTLLLEDEETPISTIQEWLNSVIKVGVFCGEKSPRDRMSIHDALKELRSVKSLITNGNN